MNERDLPDDLQDIERRLRAARTTATPIELDELKQRAYRQARRGEGRPSAGVSRSRLVAFLLSALLIAGTTAGGIAAGGGAGGGSAAQSQYRPQGAAQPAQGVLGKSVSSPKVVAKAAPSAGAAAERATSGRGGLPFTGWPTWTLAIMGAAVLLAGFALRRVVVSRR